MGYVEGYGAVVGGRRAVPPREALPHVCARTEHPPLDPACCRDDRLGPLGSWKSLSLDWAWPSYRSVSAGGGGAGGTRGT